MKIKKILALAATTAVCAATAFSLAAVTGCSSDNVLKVGVKNNVVGFGYQDELTGEYEGMEIELASMIAEELGYDGVEYTTVTAATRGQLLDSGDLDCVLATFTITDARKEQWDFSTPYYTDYVQVMVNTSAGYTSTSTLADFVANGGGKIGVSSGSTSYDSLVAYCEENSIDTTTLEKVEYADYSDISLALSSGSVDAFCVDRSILSNWLTSDRVFLSDTFSPQNYGVATKLGSDLSDDIETLITGWLADGTISNLITKYGI